jgi:hypothetical protein
MSSASWVRSLTENPFRPLALYLVHQFIFHLVKTLDRVRNVVDSFKTFTYCLVYGKSRDLELETKCQFYDTYQEESYLPH